MKHYIWYLQLIQSCPEENKCVNNTTEDHQWQLVFIKVKYVYRLLFSPLIQESLFLEENGL